ncbi:MAG: S1 family peptidase, partial [Planctomycetaceae bacterium]|nr:S1 family peptidase [Planctomycetaceae bacterium]
MNKTASKLSKLAIQIADEFLKNGYFEPSAGGVNPITSQISADQNYNNFDSLLGGFAGVSVQGVGCAEVDGQEQIYVYVVRGDKRKLNNLSCDKDGIPVKAVKVGKTIIKPETVSTATNRGTTFIKNGRIACGSSCQPAGELYTGTFGTIVKKENKLFALSNNHVFAACNHTRIGQPIMSPSSMDTGPDTPAPRLIARHSQILELRSGDPYLVPLTSLDAAVAEIDPESVTSWQGSEEGEEGYDTPSVYITPQPGMFVKKIGRTSGLTLGKIEAEVPGQWPLEYKSKKFTAIVWFQNIWTIRATETPYFALPGDSGSLVVTNDAKHAVG